MLTERLISGMTRTDHCDGSRFFNPHGANGQPFWMAPRFLAARRTPWPAAIPVEPRQPPTVQGNQLAVSYIGHATFLIQAGGTTIITDPVYAERASPVQFAGPRRVRAPGIRFDDLPAISIVLLSHNHYDHCDLATLRALKQRFDPVFVTPLGNGRLLRSVGIEKVEELDWWDAATATSIPIRLMPAQHFSARGIFDRNRALWGGFLLDLAGKRVLFGGDSGYGPHFAEIGRRHGPVDLALLPIGAYEPRWFMKDIHMNPEEAVQAHRDVAARQSIAMHFGVFQLTPEAIDEPPARLVSALSARGVPASDFRIMDAGQSLII